MRGEFEGGAAVAEFLSEEKVRRGQAGREGKFQRRCMAFAARLRLFIQREVAVELTRAQRSTEGARQKIAKGGAGVVAKQPGDSFRLGTRRQDRALDADPVDPGKAWAPARLTRGVAEQKLRIMLKADDRE